ncbi:MAG: YigZ family protein [Bacteroidia bacterium]|nr:YigZ family protein [Bacteroidia bacterium]MCZ2276905.1 YigZ family protein [Bacteroidia bacterium]
MTENTILFASKGDYRESGSRFIAYLNPVSNVAEIKNILNQIKTEHPAATHVCYAYRLNRSKLEYSVDAGEPAGSAGKPILRSLQKNRLTDVLCVVVRYYGGRKLGIPGLMAAYSASVNEALKNNQISRYVPILHFTITLPYILVNEAIRLIKSCSGRVEQINKETQTEILVIIPEELLIIFKRKIEENQKLHGSCKLQITESHDN